MSLPSWPSVRLALASPALAAGVRAWLEDSGLEVVTGEADVLIVDDRWLEGVETLVDLPAIVALGSPGWVRVLAEVAPAGWAVLGTDATPRQVLGAVLAAASGLAALPADQVLPLGHEPEEELSLPDVTLTPRERDVLAGLAEGLTNKRIARELQVSESTVKFHVQALYSKLGVQSRAGAVARGIGLGLVSV